MQEIAAILQIVSSISSTLALDEILTNFTEKTTEFIGADSCAISHWDRENGTVVVLAQYRSPTITSSDSIDHIGAAYPLQYYPATARVLHEQTSLIIYTNDPTADEAERELLQSFGREGLLMVPMLYRDRTIGLLELYTDDNQRYQFSNDDVTLCQAIASQAAVAIENAHLVQESEEGRLHAEAMQVISRILASELDYQRIVNNAANFAYRLLMARFVYIVVPEADTFRPVAIIGHESSGPTAAHYTDALLSLLAHNRLAQLRSGPVVVSSIQREATLTTWYQKNKIQDWQSFAAVPLLSHDQMIAVLIAFVDQPDFFKPNDVAALMSLASQTAVAIQNARLFEELETQREKLHQVSLRLAKAQEEERRRISRELHDQLGQTLTALKINLDVSYRILPPDSPEQLQISIREASTLAKQTLESARNLSLELHPAMLDDLGLVAALRWEIDRYEQRMGQTVQFEANLKDTVLLPELKITIYRIVIEALTNAARHAQANEMSVQLRLEDQQVKISIEDNGVGFDAEALARTPTKRQSLGLVSMRERAELLGGALHVRSMPGKGTRVKAQIPIGPKPI